MKKLLLLLFLIPVLASAQKTTGGNYTYIAQRYEWLAGVFKALGLPAGSGPAAFTAGQEMRAGAVYFDSLGVDAGFYIWSGSQWVLQGSPLAAELPDALIQPGYVTYSGTGFKFYISPSLIRVGGVIYGTGYDSVTLSASDPTDPRKDVIYVATTGIEVAEGTPAGPAAEPQLDADQFKLTVIDIPAAATVPGITQTIIWDENTESVVTNSGTTTDPDDVSNPYHLTKDINVTNFGNSDRVIINLPSTLNATSYDGISLFLKNKVAIPTGTTIRIIFYNGPTRVSNEVIMGVTASQLTYQGISLAMTKFSFSNSFFDNIHIRYVGNTASTGLYLDYIFMQKGLVQGGGAGTPLTIGPIDGKTAVPNGAVIENNIFYQQHVTQTVPGLMSAADKTKLDSIPWDNFIDNVGDGEPLAVQVNDSTIGIKSIKIINGVLTPTDSTLTIDLSGVGDGGLSEIIAGYGLLNVNDSTLDVDSLVIANRDWVMDRITDAAPNLLADSVGAAGISPVTWWDNTLHARRISISGGSIDTTASGGLLITVTGGGSGITSLNTLTGATQTFATGTSGTDFNISSTGTTHTFNIPTASATNRGVIGTGGSQTLAPNFTFTGSNDYGTVKTGGTSTTSNFFASTGSAAVNYSSAAQFQLEGSASASLRAAFNGNTAYLVPANNIAGNVTMLGGAFTEASSGTTPLFYTLALTGATITNGAGATANMATLYIKDAPSGVTPTDQMNAIWVASGNVRLGKAGASTGTMSFEGATSGKVTLTPAAAAGTPTLTFPTTSGTFALTTDLQTLTKNAMVENPTASENLFMFRTPVAITVTDVTAVLVGGTPSVTYNIAFGTDRSSGTNVYTAGQTVTSETTGTAASGVNDATIPAGSWIWITTSAATDVTQLNISLTYTED